MSAHRYADYLRDRPGWFLGLGGTQLAAVAAAGLPALLALDSGDWPLLLACLLGWLLVTGAVVAPVRGRPTARWLLDLSRYAIGELMHWNEFTSLAASGSVDDSAAADLPGVLAGVRVHDGPPFGPTLSRPALVQDRAAHTWAAVGRLVHPGIGLAEPADRNRMGAGLAELCEIAARTDLVDLIALQVRTVPDDGAERTAWTALHGRRNAPRLAREVTELLHRSLAPATVRTETFLTLVVSDAALARPARQSGGGLAGRAHVLQGLMSETEAVLRGALGCTDVDWLDSPGLAAAIRTGFAPGDRGELVAAAAARDAGEPVAADQAIAASGPGQARTEPRHYRHDAWCSVTATVLLPEQGAVLGALAPVLVPSSAGERRCLTVFLQPLPAQRSDRLGGREQMSATTGSEIRARLGLRERPRQRRDTERLSTADEQLARGRALVRAGAAACVTVPASWPVHEYGRRLSAAIRLAGYVPLRLDLAQDAGFAAAAVPLGIGLPTRGGRR